MDTPATSGPHPTSTPTERRGTIIDTLFKQRTASIEEIADKLQVSPATIYRDVQTLVEAGIVERKKGYLRALIRSTAELPPRVRRSRHQEEKKRLAQAASELISSGDVIILDDSSTVIPLSPLLEDYQSLTVITNSLVVAREITNSNQHELVLIGGRYRKWADAFYGSLSTRMVEELRADLCIMSDAAAWGGATYNPTDYVIDMKRTMLTNSAERILLLDHSKLERRAWQKTTSLSTFTHVFATAECTSEDIAALRSHSRKLTIV